MQDFVVLERCGEPISVPVRRSGKARNTSIRITVNGPELVFPLKVSTEKSYNFLLSKESWVRKKIKENLIPNKIRNDIIPFFGENHTVTLTLSAVNLVKLNGSEIEVCSSKQLSKTLLQIFLKKRLLKEIVKLAEIIKEQHKLHYNNIRIIESNTKWGSCSDKGNLSFNWRLVFSPIEVVKYLVVHEMAHLKEMNHSKNFWALVEKIYPEYKIEKLWLRKNGKRLHKFFGEINVGSE